ncbi:MAG: hypothetical protein BMS9Abin37_2300 [Acidobacteriota bacterium]|nr:MAG: hypothetical protein BMS9Abin37_2300 [Acidobacteriota bacterium]
MNSVFIGGSRNLGRLNDAIRKRLENIIEKNLLVLVGDASGADKAIQKYFSDRNYQNVLVYCMEGACRNNLGNWEFRCIASDGRKRGWKYFAMKDAAMAKDASCGFMIWDGRSKGTLNNVLNLMQNGKVAVLYFSPGKTFFTIRSPDDLREVLSRCTPSFVTQLATHLNLERRLQSIQNALPFEDRAALQTAETVGG